MNHSSSSTSHVVHEVKTETSTSTIGENATNGSGDQPSASNATRELDDLMASLSDFKVKGGQGQSQAVVCHAPMPEVPRVSVMTARTREISDDNILPHTTVRGQSVLRIRINLCNLHLAQINCICLIRNDGFATPDICHYLSLTLMCLF